MSPAAMPTIQTMPTSPEPPSDAAFRRARFEVAALLVTGTLHVVFETFLHAKIFYVPAAALFWIIYLARRIAREPGLLGEWGFRLEGLPRASLQATLAAVPCAAFLAVLSRILGNDLGVLLEPRVIAIFAAYPIWGIAQQFLLQALLAANVRRLTGSPVAATLVAALLFGCVHAPDWALCGLTFGVALLFVPLYFAAGNLWPLGIYHGWLGTLAYYGVLGRDAWAAFLGE